MTCNLGIRALFVHRECPVSRILFRSDGSLNVSGPLVPLVHDNSPNITVLFRKWTNIVQISHFLRFLRKCAIVKSLVFAKYRDICNRTGIVFRFPIAIQLGRTDTSVLNPYNLCLLLKKCLDSSWLPAGRLHI